jgi:hypothetical protein
LQVDIDPYHAHCKPITMRCQVLKARPSDISKLFLLCPTLTHILDTPNGRRLSVSLRN